MNKKQIAIFASGSGTNAERIMSHFNDHTLAKVSVVLSNKPDAMVLVRAARFGVPSRTFNREEFNDPGLIPGELEDLGIDLIVLAGFLWLVPVPLIRKFPQKIINIHPALLPKYGGKGMYGKFVHQAVIRNAEKESGISIHYVNEIYDDGKIVHQARCEVRPDDTPETLASRIHELEYEHYPLVIEKLLLET